MQNLWVAAKAVLRGKFNNNRVLPQETRKTWNRQPNFTPKIIEKRTKSPQNQEKEEIIKIRAEINENKMKETMVKINKTKSWFFEKTNKIDKP